jgi:hypothetical protein
MAAEANLSLLRQHAAVILARQQAQRAVKKRIQKEGRIRVYSLSLSTLTRLGNDYLQAHPELLAEAAADPIVQNLTLTHRKAPHATYLFKHALVQDAVHCFASPDARFTVASPRHWNINSRTLPRAGPNCWRATALRAD